MKFTIDKRCLAILMLGFSFACGHSDEEPGVDEVEVITTVKLTFTPVGGAMPTTVSFDDPDGDGGDPPTIDGIALTPGEYNVDVVFENGLEDPPEDITIEIADESDQHQVFLTGSAVEGPASNNAGAALLHAYADQDANALPIGLVNTVSASAGTGDLILTLRHLPPVAGAPVKTANTSMLVRDGGFASIGGSSDAQVTFPVRVE